MALALHDCARSGDCDALTTLIGQGANLNQKDKHQRTALHLAAWAGHVEVVKALLAAGADKNAGAQDDMNALHFAAQKGRTEVVRWLLNEGACACEWACALRLPSGQQMPRCWHPRPAAGLHVNSVTRKGMSALHFAAQNGEHHSPTSPPPRACS